MSEADLIHSDIEAYLALQQKKEILRFLTAGSVDDGKSTLIGRLLHDANTVYDDQLAALHRDSAKKSAAGGEVDYSLLVDGLLAEREQGITIDVAYRYFSTEKRKFIIADTPGHEQYTRNMATGASTADLAVILVDARLGVLPQTRRHTFIASLLGIRHVVVAVNKMDVVGYAEDVFARIVAEYAAFADKLKLASIHYLPLSALRGDNVVAKSAAMPWYDGPPLLRYLETVPLGRDEGAAALRFPVQYVVRPDLDYRGFAGTVASGVIRRGDDIVCLPSGRTSKVARIVTHDGDREEAAAPLAVSVTLADEIDVSRGDVLAHAGAAPQAARSIEAMVVWMHETPLRPGTTYLVKHTTRIVPAEITEIHDRVDVTTLDRRPARALALNDIGRITLTAARPLLFDPYTESRATGAFILIDRLTNGTFGAGMILGRGASEPREAGPEGGREAGHPAATRGVSPAERRRRLGQRPAVVVLGGGDLARLEALSRDLERRLWDEGYTVAVLAPSEAAAIPVCHRLGMVTVVPAGTTDVSAHTRSLDPQEVVALGGEVTVDAVLAELRRRELVR
jgi:bifunctional enzyme CysN/CysC